MADGILFRRPELDLTDIYARNAPFIKGTPSSYSTTLGPMEEQMFRGWVAKNNVPFNPSSVDPQSDYDMRGFYRGLVSGDPKAMSAIDPNDTQMHYPDYWKTPYHETFSNQSQWALPHAPSWDEQDKLTGTNGRIIFDDRRSQN